MPAGEVVIKVRNLKKYFELKKGFFSFGGEVPMVKAVDDVNFDIRSGEILGLVGESGCGKTTTGRLLTRLEDPTGGFVFFLGRDIALLEGSDVKVFRRNIQMVFQDPYDSLNPRTTVLQTIMEPLINHNIGQTPEERIEMVVHALEDAGLAPAKEYLNRFPHELSGGQRQRVSIARALVIKPKVIIADEPVSMLDVSIRAGVLNLMLDLRDKYGIPYLFITHDIAVARYVSDRLAVMYLGRVVELAETDKVIFEPKHPYTQALLSAVPVPDPEAKHGRIKIKGEIPSAANVPLGCRFRPRCPKAFRDCGWQAEDLVEWLEAQGLMAAGGPMAKDVDKLHPDGFALGVHLKSDASPDAVVEFLRSKTSELKATEPMFQAIEAIDSVRGDKVLEISCAPAKLSAKELAEEIAELLESAVSYREIDHPMHGIITDIKTQEDKVVVSVGGDGKGELETTEAFLKDFVKHYRRGVRPEFSGVKSVARSTQDRSIVMACAASKEPAATVAKDIANTVARDYPRANDLGRFILPLKVKKNKVRVRVMGPEENWSSLQSSLRGFLEERARKGDRRAGAVSGMAVRPAKGPKHGAAVKFITVDEPPEYDTGGGHLVACYLFRPASK